MKQVLGLLLSLALVGLTASCAPLTQPPLQPLDSGSSRAAGSKYMPKVDNFQVILDSSLSMDDARKDYFVKAREVVSRLNQGVPTDLNYQGGLRSIGHSKYQSTNPTDLLYGMTSYDRQGFHNALGKVKYVGGPTPMAAGLRAAGNDLSGKSAVILVSDGLHMDDAPAAAKELKAKLGSDFCIYTIAIGKPNNGMGQDMLEQLADIGQCGFATTDAELAGDAQMAGFIDKVFVANKPASKPVAKAPAAPGDSDGDGVTDDKDKCPNTPRGEFVDENGCTLKLTLHINFDFDKAEIKPEFKLDLDRAAAYIRKYSDVPYILIAGHTDHTGTMEYNQELSEKRAISVRQYLVANYNIDGSRLYTKGYGKMQPVADNTSKEGRYQNRRVEIICCAIKPPE